FKPQPANSSALTATQSSMKKRFDIRHGARHRLFKVGESVLVELWSGQRVQGNIKRLIGNAIAEVQVGNDCFKRHYSQIWKDRTQQNITTYLDLDDDDEAEKEIVPIGSEEPSVDASESQEPTPRSFQRRCKQRIDYRTAAGFRRY